MFWILIKIVKVFPYKLAIVIVGINAKDIKIFIKNNCSLLFIAVLLKISPNLGKTIQISIGKLLDKDKLIYAHNEILLS